MARRADAYIMKTSDATDWHMMKSKERIRGHFQAMTERFLDTLEELKAARRACNLSESEWFVFCEMCGFDRKIIPALMKIDATLGHKRETLEEHGVTIDTIVALVETDPSTRSEALRQIEAGALLTSNDVQRISIERRKRPSTTQSLSQVRREGMVAGVKRLAASKMNEMCLEASKLLQAIRKYKWMQASPLTIDVPSDADPEAKRLAFIRKAEAKRNLQALIIETASNLLIDFDLAFPDANLGAEDWFHPRETSVRNEFSQCRHAIKVLADGDFSKEFPSAFSEPYEWSVEASISFLAGAIPPHRPTSEAKRLRRAELTAIDINAGIGGTALGLHEAGFHVAALYTRSERERQSIAFNLAGWNIRQQVLGDKDNSADVNWCLTNNRREQRPLDLLAGKLDFGHWRKQPDQTKEYNRRSDVFDKDEVLRRARRLLAEYLPEGFVLEAPLLINEPRNFGDTSRALIAFSELGYEIQQTPVSATMVGLPQRRDRILIVGVLKKYATALRQPILRTPIRPKLGELILDAAFPYLSEFSPLLSDTWYPQDIADNRIAYDEWAMKWLGRFGTVIVPDTMTLAKVDAAVRQKWRDCGFDIDKREPLSPDSSTHFDDDTLVPLTIPILRRLQGLPEEWNVVPDPNARKVQRHVGPTPDREPETRPTATTFALLAETTPPAIARLAAHVVRSAITGETVNLDHEARQLFSTTGGHGTELIGPRNFGHARVHFNINRKWIDFDNWRRDRLEEKGMLSG